MAYANPSSGGFNAVAAAGALASKLGGGVAGLADAWRRARTFQRTYAELEALTTRELDDLGLSRSMITRVAYEAAYGPKA